MTLSKQQDNVTSSLQMTWCNIRFHKFSLKLETYITTIDIPIQPFPFTVSNTTQFKTQAECELWFARLVFV